MQLFIVPQVLEAISMDAVYGRDLGGLHPTAF
jgi:hypothetical protein